MRFSPVVLAAIAISSVSGLAAPAARAQTAPLSEQLSQGPVQQAPHEPVDASAAAVGDAAAPPSLVKPALLPGAIARAEVDAALGMPEGAIAATPDSANSASSANSANSTAVNATALAERLAQKPAEPQLLEASAPSAVETTSLGTADPTTSSTLSKLALPQTGTSRLGDPIELAQFIPQPQPTPAEATPTAPPEEEPRVLVSELVVSGAPSPELEDAVFNAISTRAGATTTRTQLQRDINAVFATGFFSDVRAVPEDTPLGVRVTFVVQPNPVLTAVQIQGNEVLPQQVVDQTFGTQYGRVLNLNQLQTGIRNINRWYQDNGYVLAQIIDAPRISQDGVVTLSVAEGVIEDINVAFQTEDGETEDDDGNPIRGRTRAFIITREFETKPGDVFNQNQIQQDLQRAFRLGLFDDLQVTLNPGDDPRKVDVTINAVERSSGSISAGVGVSSASGLFGTVSYQEQNLGGNNQRLGAEVQFGQRDLLFDISFTDPWIAGDPNRTSYTVNAFSRRSIPLVFQGGETEVTLENGDRPRVRRIGGGVTFGRPLGNGWRATAGLQYQNIRLQDSDGDLAPVDELGNQLSFSESGTDDILLVQLSASQDRRDSAVAPTRGYNLRISTDQSIPVGQGNIFFNRLRGSYSRYFPVDITDFTEGPETLAFNVQGGVVLGDLPPYEAFSLGGTDSVRGYEAGDVGSGRAFVLGTVEYRFPIFSIVGGVLFVDVGSDLGTGSDVPGQPAVVRDKPGTGIGFGLGIRVQSPIGAIRVDLGFNDEGDSRIHFGIGERF
ncbi:BamA/TamA family outer membrane protein [Thermoleptolyngbya sp. C42_A2020_037]|uniref:BamA/TamA family outer membrane protein n=1 Tax=Thermoleptolyngbya sp. C42_A2020_037 TaxID=2747799 RepID=UPI0019E04181|nr:BamA/TamA family outer membrane protein [Thermoleptolyngbya sp. C42_A2020_037]MBF2085580.1 BamA/TamA family outer membrane protein [Thermoleptolyngbya sp. C42_A2020_037]